MVGRRICVVGTSGSGKTHVAKALARILSITYVCNDELIWGPDWTPVAKEQVLVAQERALAVSAWTFDGNLTLSRPEDRLALERCDTLVWLDLPRREVWPQVVRRTLKRIVTREELWHGNRESLRTALSGDSIVWWSIKTYSRRRREYSDLFSAPDLDHLARIRIRSRREVNRWLRSVTAGV
jgi:adenylate kinase family enzyme